MNTPGDILVVLIVVWALFVLSILLDEALRRSTRRRRDQLLCELEDITHVQGIWFTGSVYIPTTAVVGLVNDNFGTDFILTAIDSEGN